MKKTREKPKCLSSDRLTEERNNPVEERKKERRGAMAAPSIGTSRCGGGRERKRREA